MKPKGIAALIVGSMAAKKGASKDDDGPDTEDSADESEDTSNETALAAAAELRDAMNGDDDQAIVDAFKALRDCCSEMD